MSEIPDFILRELLGPPLHDAMTEARTRTGDATIMVRIGDNPSPDPDVWSPGLASIERDGVETVYGLSLDDAVAQLAALV